MIEKQVNIFCGAVERPNYTQIVSPYYLLLAQM